ncbi:MAG: type 1 glutamine amidotransferase domain-containing protein [Candidatus Caldarchaeum sp.]
MRACILAGPEFEDLELHYPLIRLKEEGYQVTVVGPERAIYNGKHGIAVQAEKSIDEVKPDDFDILVIPGGWAPDRLRRNRKIVEFVEKFFNAGKTVAAICHGPQLLISAKALKGYTATCAAAIKDDVENAGAKYVDKPVVVDRNLITSRGPSDLHVFVRAIIRPGDFR